MSKKKQPKQASRQTEQQKLAKKHATIRRKWRNAALAVCGAGLIAVAGFGISRADSIRSGDLHGAEALPAVLVDKILYKGGKSRESVHQISNSS